MKLKELPDEEMFTRGHTACAGCGGAIAVRNLMKILGKDTVVVNPACCLLIFGATYPNVAWKVPAASLGNGRVGTNVVFIATTLRISPTRYLARSTQCELIPACAPDPAVSFRRCQVSGKFGSTSHDCRYAPRQWKMRPILPSAMSCRAKATAGHLRYSWFK